MKYRVLQDVGNNCVVQTPYAIDESGNRYPMPISYPGKIHKSKIKPGCPVIPLQTNLQKMNYSLPYAVVPTESPAGSPGSARVEQPAVQSTRRPITVTISNGYSADETLLIGDGFGLFAIKQSVAAKNALTVIGGTYGTATLTKLQEITKSSAFDLHGLHITGSTTAGAASDIPFTQGSFSTFYTSPDLAYVQEAPIPVSDLVTGSTYTTNVREDQSFRFQVNGYTGIKVVVPTGYAVTITFKNLVSFGGAANMILLGRI